MCWGDDAYGQAAVPAGLGAVSAISTGSAHTCVIKADGAPVCWGDDAYGQAVVPAGLGTVTAISAGFDHTCVIKTDGTPVCWGKNNDGQLSPSVSLSGSLTQATGEAFAVSFSARMSSVSFAVTAGSLPSGLSLSSEGLLTGSSTVTGSFPITVTATNGLISASTSVTVTVFDTAITTPPTDPSNASSGSIGFSSMDGSATFICALDSGTPVPCASPFAYSDLSDGSHTFSVAATVNGQVDPTPATATWTIDTTSSNVTIDTPAPDVTSDTHAPDVTRDIIATSKKVINSTSPGIDPPDGELPVTGSNPVPLVVIGFVAIVAGGVIELLRRRRNTLAHD